MKRKNIQKFVLTAVLAALSCAATLVIHIPTPTGGYVNLGDAIVILSGFILGPSLGAIAGGIGSGLADIFSGYPVYAPGTIIIKALMALSAALIFRTLKKKNISIFLSSFVSEIVMILGYLMYEWIFMGMGYGAAAGILANITQGVFGFILSIILAFVFKKNSFLNNYLNGGSF